MFRGLWRMEVVLKLVQYGCGAIHIDNTELTPALGAIIYEGRDSHIIAFITSFF